VKKVKSHTSNASANSTKKTGFVNPFIQMMEDKAKIADAFQKGEPLTSLKDIKFVKPL
jgi:hypothetical protein